MITLPPHWLLDIILLIQNFNVTYWFFWLLGNTCENVAHFYSAMTSCNTLNSTLLQEIPQRCPTQSTIATIHCWEPGVGNNDIFQHLPYPQILFLGNTLHEILRNGKSRYPLLRIMLPKIWYRCLASSIDDLVSMTALVCTASNSE